MEPDCYLFRGDSYDTPADNKASWVYRMMLNSRWYFYFNNFRIFFNTGRCGKRGELDQINQIVYSNQNLKLIEKCGGQIHLRGLDNLRSLNGQPVVLIGNHMSLLETAVFHSVIRGILDFTFVIKKQLLEIPFFKEIMIALEAIPVGRDNPREDLRAVMNEGKRLLSEGRSIIIFPQSTRSEEFNPEKFNSIGIKLAKNAGVPVVPFALKTDFLGNGKVFRDMGPVRPGRQVWFEFAAPINVEGNGQAAQQEIIEFIQSRLAEWKPHDQTGER
ncbi:MAG: 1-acyl-sn-glycerol-3-phosphate acyltransferase [Lentisphaeria bacterium]|nr:1-acyl-sn-glycerol-3-phosphate acyltransferase [Lentisphaeria bacterium]